MSQRMNASDVWKVCKRLEDGNRASCLLCSEILHCKGGSTSTLRKHMRLCHPQTSSSASNVGASFALANTKISGYFGKARPPVNRQRQEQLRHKLVEMILENLRPVDIINMGRGFFAVVEFLHPSCPRIGYRSIMARIRIKYV